MAAFHNQLNFERWLLLESDPDVEQFCEFPADATAWINRRFYRVRIHLWIRYRDGSNVFENLSYKEVNPRRPSPEQRACQDWAERQAGRHVTLTQAEVRTSRLLLENLERILGHYNQADYARSLDKAISAKPEIIEAIKRAPGISVGVLLRAIAKRWCIEPTRYAVFDLILGGQVEAGLSRRLFDSSTRVNLTKTT